MRVPKSRTDAGHEDEPAVAPASCARQRQHRQEWRASELAALALPGFPADADAFRRWLERREVPRRRERVQGGKAFIYLHADLPSALRLAVDRKDAAAVLGLGADIPPPPRTPEAAPNDHSGVSQMPQWKQKRASARMIAVKAFRAWCSARQWSPGGRAAEVFADAWRSGEIAQRFALGDDLNSFAACTLLAWQKTLNDQGEAALAGSYKPAKPKIERHPAMFDLAEAIIVQWPHVSGANLHAAIELRTTELGLKAPSKRSCQRWLANWKRKNERTYAHLESPDGYKSKYRPAFGSASEGVTRLNQVWEFDDTPSDIVLADGQRYAVIGMIDVWSRRLMLQVHRSSTSHGISLLMRRALLTFGVPETVRTDNGAAYVSRHITEVLKRLDVTHDILPPFSPQRKPFIESVFKTFAHDLVELLPGFVGHSVAEAQALRARQTFAQRLFGRGDAVELRMSAADFQAFCDDWTEGYHGRSHGALRTTPALRAAQWTGRIRTITDERALDVLLAPLAGGDGRRTVTKKGIRVENGLFIAPRLGDLVGETVECRQDPADAGRIYVFDDAGRFVCIAEDPDRTGVSRDEIAAAARAHAQKRLKEHRAELRDRRRTELPDPDTLARDIITARIAAAPKVLAFPRPADVHASEGLEQSGKASRAEETPIAAVRTSADARRGSESDKAIQRSAAASTRDIEAEKRARVSRGIAAWDALNGGAAIPEMERAWFEAYETTTEFLNALFLARGVDIRRGYYRPIGLRRVLKA